MDLKVLLSVSMLKYYSRIFHLKLRPCIPAILT